MTRKELFIIVEKDSTKAFWSQLYDHIMFVMIIISVIPLTFSIQTPLFIWFDRVSVSVFIIDYILRWITADYRNPSKTPVVAFLTYPVTFMAIIDLLSILPSLGIFNKAFKVLRIVRLLKLLRVLRFLRYSKNIDTLLNVLKKERQILLTVLGIAIFYIVVTAMIMFNVEMNNANPNGEYVFQTFFDALYWATTTLTTVGYGDISPVSELGRVISMISSLFGVAIIALPSGVITASYLEEIKKGRKIEN
jgi:voltage-gated potassium channel